MLVPGQTSLMTLSFKWLPVLLTALLLRAPCSAQKVNIRGKELAISHVLEEIGRQTGYAVLFSPSTLHDAPAVSLDSRNVDVRQVLHDCFAGLQLGYHIEYRTIVVFRKVGEDVCVYSSLDGRVQSSEGEPLEGASISVGGYPVQVTAAGGLFRLPVKALRSVVTISFQGYSPQTVHLSNSGFHIIVMQPMASLLDNVVIQPYGRTTQRLLTSAVAQVQGSEVESQPVGNVLEGLEGRVPGMTTRQYNGVPGSAFGVLIRGRQSISQGTDPLVVIDGVPISGNNGYLATIGSGSAQGPMGASVLNGIPPSAIASIVVLKDAAATAIYGSRGANGVLLLTLKTGKAGRLKWGVDVYSGNDRVVKTSSLLNTGQYLALREEAVQNDGPSANDSVPEESLWDNTRYTNFKKEVMGKNAVRQNARIDLSGGDSNTAFLISGNYYKQSAVFPGPTSDDRFSLYGHLHWQSHNQRLRLDLSALYSWNDNQLPIQDYTPLMSLAPNAPPFLDAAGQPVWSANGLSYVNIPALQNNAYRAGVNNQFDRLQLTYDRLLPGLVLRSNLGYYRLQSDERSQVSIAGQDPANDPVGQTLEAGNTGQTELIDGLAEYSHSAGAGKVEGLLGVTWQEQQTTYASRDAVGYTSDLLLETGGGNPTVTLAGNSVVYRYEAIFGRVNYNLDNRYIVTLSGRRDGSSRFGPGKEFGNFWGIGSAWIFSEEPFLKNLSWLSFGKLRSSLGTTGNDQIGDMSYGQAYTPTMAARGYQGLQGAYPTSFSNPDLHWEVNYSSDLALDLGFLNNKILLSAAVYRDWTGNQLIYNALPSQSGLPGLVLNMPVRIVNEGLEFSLQTFNLTRRHFRWVSTASVTVPVNRLARFTSLSTSYYANSLAVGKSLSVVKGFRYEGVSVDSGLFEFQGMGPDGTIDPRDQVTGGNLDPRYYGSLNQGFRYKNWQLDLLFEFRVQNGFNPFVVLYQINPPGVQAPSMLGNGPVEWLDHWRQPGDRALLQKLTASQGSVANQRIFDYIGSDAQARDASFIRWKSLSLSYRLHAGLLSRCSLGDARIYLKGENLLTVTHFPVADPETQDPTVLPPVRSLVAGISLSF
jgi:TonB-dependent starch-binding outer membrane protein SusC